MAKPKTYLLIRPIEAVIARDDETNATFHPEDVGLEYADNDPAVKRAVELFPDHFRAA